MVSATQNRVVLETLLHRTTRRPFTETDFRVRADEATSKTGKRKHAEIIIRQGPCQSFYKS